MAHLPLEQTLSLAAQGCHWNWYVRKAVLQQVEGTGLSRQAREREEFPCSRWFLMSRLWGLPHPPGPAFAALVPDVHRHPTELALFPVGSEAARRPGCLWDEHRVLPQGSVPMQGLFGVTVPPCAREKVTFCLGQELRMVFTILSNWRGSPKNLGHQVVTLENQMVIDVIKFYWCMATLPHLHRPWLFYGTRP